MNKLFRTLILSTATVTFLAACDDDDNNPTSAGDPTQDAAQVRVAHLSPDAPPVDVWVDNTLVLEDVPFRAFSGYLELEPGQREIVVVPANQTEPAVIHESVQVQAGMEYTVAATGLLADDSIAPAIFVDDVEPTAGKAEIRFVHASPDAPPVDITLLDGTKLFADVMFGKAGEAIAVDAGAYSLQVRVAGTATVALSFADVPVSAGNNYSVFAIGLLADGSIDAIVAVDALAAETTAVDLTPASAEVRVAHLVPEAPAVDVWVDGNQVLSGVPFEAISDYLTVSAATHTVRVVVENTTTDVIPETALTFDPNTASTVAATGLASNVQPLVLLDSREAATAGNSRARFVHTSPDAPPVDIKVVDGPVLFSGFAFGEASEYAEVPAGSYNLEVRLASEPAGRGTLVKTFSGVSLENTTTYSIFATRLAAELNAKAVQDNK